MKKMKNAIYEIKNTLERITIRLDEAENWISEQEDKVERNIEVEQWREKRLKRYEDSLRELRDNMKHNNIQIIGIPEGEQKEQGIENLFEKIMTELPKHEEGKTMQAQEAQTVLIKMNPTRPTLRHTMIKKPSFKDKERIFYFILFFFRILRKNLKSSKGETDSNTQESFDKVNSWFLKRNTTSQKGMARNIPSDEKQRPAAKTTLSSKALIENWRWNEELPRQKKAKIIHLHQTSISRHAKGTV